MGAVLTERVNDGPFTEMIYVLNSVTLQLLADYGSWRVNVRFGERDFSPASFWIAALDGVTEFPDPAVTDADIEHLDSAIDRIVAEAASLAAPIEAMGGEYRRAMGERLT
jgi:hypothetical protein